jgi:hypothetical protein
VHPPCNYDTGEVKHVQGKPQKDRKEWIRRYKVMAFCDLCECKFSSNDYLAASPELNPAELAQNRQKHNVLPALFQNEGIERTDTGG